MISNILISGIHYSLMLNLYNPAYDGLYMALITSYLLGIIHGVTPDEHTWPITFSYSVGSYSMKGGFRSGLLFSSGFTIQRAILSEIAYLSLAGIFMTSIVFGITYVAVGAAMAAAGVYIYFRKTNFHIHIISHYLERLAGMHREHPEQEKMEEKHTINPVMHEMKPIPPKMAFAHGIIAGFGFGAFALIIYTVLAPSMPSPYIAFLPGMLFGLGTMTMQIIFGMAFGSWMGRKKLSKGAIEFVARYISRSTLVYGGIAFIIAGIFIIFFPGILNYNIITPVYIHNIHNLGIGFFLVIFTVVVVGVISYFRAMRIATKNRNEFNS